MYDRVSLSKLLIAAGYSDPQKLDMNRSNIPGWTPVGLEVEPDGTLINPDSMYVEAFKP